MIFYLNSIEETEPLPMNLTNYSRASRFKNSNPLAEGHSLSFRFGVSCTGRELEDVHAYVER